MLVVAIGGPGAEALRGEFVKREAEGVDVATGIDGFAIGLFGAHVPGGADDDADLRTAAGRSFQGARQAKIDQVDVVVMIDHQIRRLDVAVYVPFLVGVGDARATWTPMRASVVKRSVR